MAKCPVCRGKGYRLRIDDMRFAMAEIVKCESCDGKGAVKPLTEQEYIQTCNTEQLAEELLAWWIDGADTYNHFGLFQHEIDGAKEKIMKWLKEKHDE